MGIQVIFYPARLSTPEERALDKVKVCVEAVKFFRNSLFYPQDIQVWLDASSVALGGMRLKQLSMENFYENTSSLLEYLKTLNIFDLSKTIILFNGTWEFNGVSTGGYFSVQNQEDWRKTYGDIALSAYARNEFEDIVDALWSLENGKGIAIEFVKTITRPDRSLHIKPSLMSFTNGLFSENDPTNLRALYLSGERKSLLRMFYKALLASKDENIVAKSKPIETRFLIETLMSNAIVTERIDRRLERDLVDELPARSTFYYGRKPDSFKNLFHEISEAVLKPAFSKLPKAEIVEQKIDEGLRDYEGEW